MSLSAVPKGEFLLANVVKLLLEENETDTVRVLLSCSMEVNSIGGTMRGVIVTVTGPYFAYKTLQSVLDSDGLEEINRHYDVVKYATEEVMPNDWYLSRLLVRMEMVEPEDDWRSQVAKITDAKIAHNQNPERPGQQVIIADGLRYNSETERRVAKALDAARVLFFPNSIGRLSNGDRRTNRMPDFLVCDRGKWGILEVDGEPFHPSAAKDHDRDRLFRAYGIKCVERYPATRCYQNAPDVVREFLTLLQRNG